MGWCGRLFRLKLFRGVRYHVDITTVTSISRSHVFFFWHLCVLGGFALCSFLFEPSFSEDRGCVLLLAGGQ